jgi:hypothetical protein
LWSIGREKTFITSAKHDVCMRSERSDIIDINLGNNTESGATWSLATLGAVRVKQA